MTELKKELYKQCAEYVQKRMEAAQLAIGEAQKASNDDTKSSAGDKYETGRAIPTDVGRKPIVTANS